MTGTWGGGCTVVGTRGNGVWHHGTDPVGTPWYTSRYPQGPILCTFSSIFMKIHQNSSKFMKIHRNSWNRRQAQARGRGRGHEQTPENTRKQPKTTNLRPLRNPLKHEISWILLKNTEIHRFYSFLVIERTKTVHVDTSDLIVTRLGNDGHFSTLFDRKCSTGQRTSLSYRSSLQKVLPLTVS